MTVTLATLDGGKDVDSGAKFQIWGFVTKKYTSEVGDYGDWCRRRWRENCGLFSWFCDGNILMRVIALVCIGYLPCKIGLDL